MNKEKVKLIATKTLAILLGPFGFLIFLDILAGLAGIIITIISLYDQQDNPDITILIAVSFLSVLMFFGGIIFFIYKVKYYHCDG